MFASALAIDEGHLHALCASSQTCQISRVCVHKIEVAIPRRRCCGARRVVVTEHMAEAIAHFMALVCARDCALLFASVCNPACSKHWFSGVDAPMVYDT